MPAILAEGFNLLQDPENIRQGLKDKISVKSIKSEFGKGIKDEDWIPLAGKKGACVITQDYNLNRITHQKALCEKYKLGMFYFRPPSKNGFSYWDMVKLLVKHWPEIMKVASKQKKPFAYRITSRSAALEKM
ncbi:MAG: hypothetical protein KDD32_05580 [Bacteroidetes bacterium]|nr:hypothetical protein [Bacteroidota bacterium]